MAGNRGTLETRDKQALSVQPSSKTMATRDGARCRAGDASLCALQSLISAL